MKMAVFQSMMQKELDELVPIINSLDGIVAELESLDSDNNEEYDEIVDIKNDLIFQIGKLEETKNKLEAVLMS